MISRHERVKLIKKKKGAVYREVSSTEEATPPPSPAPLPQPTVETVEPGEKKKGCTWCTDPTCMIRAENKKRLHTN